MRFREQSEQVRHGPYFLLCICHNLIQFKALVSAGIMESWRQGRAQAMKLLVVADEGPGIPPRARERVFARFWSGSDRGGQSGLGLAIAQAIAPRHGGTLGIGENEVSSGCVLFVDLPIAEAKTGPSS
ncbi:MAG: sensor histidine kinase [Cyanobacteriota bacterium]|nr:sensor histidine kinase [Cyanobacteriota bacterium]